MSVTFHNNTEQTCHHGNESSAPHELLIFKAIGISIIVVACILGNTLCLVVLRQMHALEPVTRVFMTSVTVADLSTGLFLGVPIIGATILDCWPYGTRDDFGNLLD